MTLILLVVCRTRRPGPAAPAGRARPRRGRAAAGGAPAYGRSPTVPWHRQSVTRGGAGRAASRGRCCDPRARNQVTALLWLSNRVIISSRDLVRRSLLLVLARAYACECECAAPHRRQPSMCTRYATAGNTARAGACFAC